MNLYVVDFGAPGMRTYNATTKQESFRTSMAVQAWSEKSVLVAAPRLWPGVPVIRVTLLEEEGETP
jgi:hypothetical protein